MDPWTTTLVTLLIGLLVAFLTAIFTGPNLARSLAAALVACIVAIMLRFAWKLWPKPDLKVRIVDEEWHIHQFQALILVAQIQVSNRTGRGIRMETLEWPGTGFALRANEVGHQIETFLAQHNRFPPWAEPKYPTVFWAARPFAPTLEGRKPEYEVHVVDEHRRHYVARPPLRLRLRERLPWFWVARPGR